MKPIVRNWIGVIGGIFVCMTINGMLIKVGSSMVPPPDGVNPEDLESIKANIHRYEPKHFAVPLVAHAAGSFVGAAIAAIICATKKRRYAMIVGYVHMAGGIMACAFIPAPKWFMVTDLALAYIPMAWLAGRWVSPKTEEPQQ